MKRKRYCLVSLMVLLCLVLAMPGICEAGKPGPLKPNRLSSIGDSMTEAIDAELLAANHWASWANGYHGFWEWLLGLTDVYSHNQRISKNFGIWGRANYMEAKSGADMETDFVGQTLQSVGHTPTYVTVLMGHNDVCGDTVADIPTDEEFKAKFEEGLTILSQGLRGGATIYVVGIVDIYRLWEIARDKKALGIVDCEVLWATTLLKLYPCGTMLNPLLTPAQRLATRERIVGFNTILQNVTREFNDQDPYHWYVYTDAVFHFPFQEFHVSDIDCFHPSACGQKLLSEITWADGPFKAYTK